jgi:hypothetical protein
MISSRPRKEVFGAKGTMKSGVDFTKLVSKDSIEYSMNSTCEKWLYDPQGAQKMVEKHSADRTFQTKPQPSLGHSVRKSLLIIPLVQNIDGMKPRLTSRSICK